MAESMQQSNFTHLRAHDEQLVRLGLLAERYFAEDPNTCLLKLRQLTELLAQMVASNVGLFTSPDEKQVDLLRRLHDHGIVPREVGGLFTEVRKSGNDANHRLAGDHRTALLCLRLTWQLSVWFHRTFKDPAFKSGAFRPPVPPANEGAELKAELGVLRAVLTQTFAKFVAAANSTAADIQIGCGFLSRPYREQAFRATETSIRGGQHAILLALVTGTLAGAFAVAVRCLLVASGLKYLVGREGWLPLAVAAEDF